MIDCVGTLLNIGLHSMFLQKFPLTSNIQSSGGENDRKRCDNRRGSVLLFFKILRNLYGKAC